MTTAPIGADTLRAAQPVPLCGSKTPGCRALALDDVVNLEDLGLAVELDPSVR
jgi:hypothetical protein